MGFGKGYPIWVRIESCAYQSEKSYGINRDGHQVVFVGTSKNNSHRFVDVNVRKSITDEYIAFRYTVDGKCIKIMHFENIKGKAGKHIKTFSKLNKIKSL